jgi:hypothetical protein
MEATLGWHQPFVQPQSRTEATLDSKSTTGSDHTDLFVCLRVATLCLARHLIRNDVHPPLTPKTFLLGAAFTRLVGTSSVAVGTSSVAVGTSSVAVGARDICCSCMFDPTDAAHQLIATDRAGGRWGCSGVDIAR